MLIVADNWWAIGLRGLAGLIFGVIAIFAPWAAFAALVLLFGAYAFVDGVLNLISAVRAKSGQRRWGSLALRGILGVVAGIFVFLAPRLAALAIVTLVGAWAVIAGILEITAAIRLRKAIRGEWLLGLSGVLSVVFGVMLWAVPVAGVVVLAWWLGAYMFIIGALQVALAYRLWRWSRTPESQDEHLLAA